VINDCDGRDRRDDAWMSAQPGSPSPRGWSRLPVVVLAVALTAGGLAACGPHHPPKPTNLTCAAGNTVQWNDQHDRWECMPKKSSSNGGSSGSSSSHRGSRRH